MGLILQQQLHQQQEGVEGWYWLLYEECSGGHFGSGAVWAPPVVALQTHGLEHVKLNWWTCSRLEERWNEKEVEFASEG